MPPRPKATTPTETEETKSEDLGEIGGELPEIETRLYVPQPGIGRIVVYHSHGHDYAAIVGAFADRFRDPDQQPDLVLTVFGLNSAFPAEVHQRVPYSAEPAHKTWRWPDRT